MDAVAHHNPATVNRLFGDLVNRGEDPAGLLPILSFQLRNLILIKHLSSQRLSSGEIIRVTGLHPYAVSSTLKQTNLFSVDWLNAAYERLVAIDWQIKTGALDPTSALDQMLVSLAS
jgi:DNA polymerase III delta subunit